ncbi:MAG TPA: DinB family protein [Vicinamibacteria bacterium]|nr:DinB family protein [Vicinamibacteria bacterium]
MNDLEFCVVRRKAEAPAFARVLKALPEDRLDYRPDPKARTARDLAWVMAVEEQVLLGVLDKGAVDWPGDPAPARAADIVAAYEKWSAAVNERLARMDEAAWRKSGKVSFGGAAWEDTVANMTWGLLFDAIHHRGQLSTYLRPMGGKVPSIYGPTADDPGQ